MMLAGSFFVWWYGLGWTQLIRKVWGNVLGVLRFFSVGQLLSSLFAPFRQISAGRTQGSIQQKMQAWGDLLFSRIIGAVVRLMLVFIGLLVALAVGIFGVVAIILWPFLPLAPLIGVFLMQARVSL